MELSATTLPSAWHDVRWEVVSQRRIPRMYVITRSGDIAFGPANGPELEPEARRAALDLIAASPDGSDRCRRTAGGQLVHVVKLAGEDAAFYSIFVEDATIRSPLHSATLRYALTEREREVLSELLRGSSTAEIAARLFIGSATVATHVRNIGCKMKATKRKEIVAAALAQLEMRE